MLRRTLITAALALPLSPLLPGLQGAIAAPLQGPDGPEPPPAAAPRLHVSQAQLQAALEQRFPRRYPGLLDLELQPPRLQLLPDSNRLRAAFALQLSTATLPRGQWGGFVVEFGLRYEPADRSVRANRLVLQDIQFPGLQPNALALLNAYAPLLAQQSMLEVVLHQLQPADLALPDAMGLQPGTITVTATGLDIGFVPKAP